MASNLMGFKEQAQVHQTAMLAVAFGMDSGSIRYVNHVRTCGEGEGEGEVEASVRVRARVRAVVE